MFSKIRSGSEGNTRGSYNENNSVDMVITAMTGCSVIIVGKEHLSEKVQCQLGLTRWEDPSHVKT